MRKIKKGDEVIAISGKNKGQCGKVVRLLEDRVVVEGLNIAKKHVKANPQAGVQGGIVDKEMPIHISNVMLFNPATGKGDRVGFRGEGQEKVRYFKSNNDVVDA
ncbi:50S ribosomal protein L24 [Piscirickettsia litoralis]|uniref:Large ribosomal subunit protein uL24 n=1 Tax=Piscirickettsia litoralis TaxID=1891921 RepID=A0ABX3A1V5_9GAMM|nr:50S ribosomal protein L24 [Piscirickettsia litoralis]ODN42808.1 50S ribosomal protein L24 [Piscirickettsia litoralis]